MGGLSRSRKANLNRNIFSKTIPRSPYGQCNNNFTFQLILVNLVPEGRLELPNLAALDFESSVFTISPLRHLYKAFLKTEC